MDLEQALADARGDAQVLRRQGHAHDAELIERLCESIAAAAEDYLTWLPEAKAALQCGHSVRWLRSRFAEWQEVGHARRTGGRQREYRAIIIPRRAQPELSRRAGERAADKEHAA